MNGGITNGGNIYESVISFSCNPGYVFGGGSEDIVCQADRNWNDTASPTCTCELSLCLKKIQHIDMYFDIAQSDCWKNGKSGRTCK